MSSELTVGRFMTRNPYTIGIDQPLSIAQRIMLAHKVRHLPVLVEGKPVGLVSERDLALIESMRGVDPDKVMVEEAMTPDPYLVSPDAPLAEVAREMAKNLYGSALIVEDGRVIGIFTTVDALQALLWVVDGGARPRTRHAAG